MSNAKMIARVSFMDEANNKWIGLADFYEGMGMDFVLEDLGRIMTETKHKTYRLSVDRVVDVPRLEKYPGWVVEPQGNRYILTATADAVA
jgi:hypothetical protein